MIFGIVFLECGTRPLGVPASEIKLGVFISAIERKDELLSGLPPGNEIQAQDDCGATSSMCTAPFQNQRAQSL